MSVLARSALIWACAFLALEIPAIFKVVPWLTLSSTVSGGIRWWHPLAVAVTVFCFTLWGHFERGWSAGYLIVEALLIMVAIGTHLATT